MKNIFYPSKNLIILCHAIIFSYFVMGTISLAHPIPDIPLSGQYALSRELGKDQQSFHVQKRKNGVLLNNQEQGFTVLLADDAGFQIRHQEHYIRIRLSSYGHGSNVWPVEPALIQYVDNRITYNHGPLQQWFINGPMGLQQGFTLSKRPEKRKNGKLTLNLSPTLCD